MKAKKPVETYPRFDQLDWSRVDRSLGLPSDDALRRFAEQINAQHEHKASTRIFTNNYRLIGLWCERHFARTFQMPMPMVLKPHGNRRVAFRLDNGWSVDVIGRTPPKGTIYPDLTVLADLRFKVNALVLVSFHGFDAEPEIIGWETHEGMAERGVASKFAKTGAANFVMHWRSLRPINELVKLHDPRHPLANDEENARPFYWYEGWNKVEKPDQPIAPDVTQKSLFGE